MSNASDARMDTRMDFKMDDEEQDKKHSSTSLITSINSNQDHVLTTLLQLVIRAKQYKAKIKVKFGQFSSNGEFSLGYSHDLIDTIIQRLMKRLSNQKSYTKEGLSVSWEEKPQITFLRSYYPENYRQKSAAHLSNHHVYTKEKLALVDIGSDRPIGCRITTSQFTRINLAENPKVQDLILRQKPIHVRVCRRAIFIEEFSVTKTQGDHKASLNESTHHDVAKAFVSQSPETGFNIPTQNEFKITFQYEINKLSVKEINKLEGTKEAAIYSCEVSILHLNDIPDHFNELIAKHLLARVRALLGTHQVMPNGARILLPSAVLSVLRNDVLNE